MKWARAFWASRIGKVGGIVAGVWAEWRSTDLEGEALTWGRSMDLEGETWTWRRSIDLGEKQGLGGRSMDLGEKH